MAIELTARAIHLPANHVLMPSIVMRISTLSVRSVNDRFPVEEKALTKLREHIPFLSVEDSLVAVVPRDVGGEKPHGFATLARVIKIEPNQSGPIGEPTLRPVALTIQGIARIRIKSIVSDHVKGEVFVDEQASSAKYTTDFVDQLKAAVAALLLPGGETATEAVRRFVSYAEGVSSPVTLVDILSSVLPLTHRDKLALLDELDGYTRARKLIAAIERRTSELKKSAKAAAKDSADSNLSRRPAAKRPSSAVGFPISGRSQNGSKSEDDDGIDQIEAALKAAELPVDGRKIVDREIKRIRRMSPQQADYNVIRNYLETLADLPWNKNEIPQLDKGVVDQARSILNADHYGLEKVKKRLLEYLAVVYLRQQQQSKKLVKAVDTSTENISGAEAAVPNSGRAPILLLVGPPGVGKTSLAKSVARALNRRLHRISLGGVRDEAEIRGHRRTYIGAMPGVLVQGLRKAGTMNPVFVLDEIDKVSQGNYSVHGDPSAALLEVLDPEQNSTFVDHYVGFPVDLSNVVFIATANSTDTIPRPLLDRMEVIPIEGYTYIEKQHIAQNYLVPKQIKANALEPGQIVVPDDVLNHIATHYTRESGVRSLEREIGTLCRARAVEILAESKDTDEISMQPLTVQIEDLPKYLGIEKFHDDVINDEVDVYTSTEGIVKHRDPYGLVNGLAYTGSGTGGILVFEATKIPNGSGKLKLTGKLGDVISESAQIAMTWVRVHAEKLGISKDELKDADIHLHAPAGAIPKDGPSAGVAMTLCFVSLLARRPVPRDIAMTGEMTLRGKILPVGGIREKLLGAHMAGVRKVLLPFHTRPMVEEHAGLIQELGIEIVYTKYIWDIFAQVWPEVDQFKEPVYDARI